MAGSRKRGLTRDQRRNLDIEIGFLEGLTRRDPEYADALRILAEDYTRRGRYLDGLKADLKLSQLLPRDPLVYYNLACSCSLANDHQQAYDALNRAIDHGYRDFRWLTKDPDLAAFRKHALYRKLRLRVREMQIRIA